MSGEGFRGRVVSELVKEIGFLSGQRFETFGYRVLSEVHPGQWMERGTTIDGAPRGYTVDASCEGARWVGEMSSEKAYFEKGLEKPRKDLEHAVALHPGAVGVWLLSNQEASAGQTTRIANLVTEFSRAHGGLRSVDILDARAIASKIFENLESEQLVSSIKGYLPCVVRLAESYDMFLLPLMYTDRILRPYGSESTRPRTGIFSSDVMRDKNMRLWSE